MAATHLKSLQALELALRLGSLKAAAAAIGITPSALGQRIRCLEEFLGHDLLLRGRSGLTPTPELDLALADLRDAFAALDRVTETLDFQRTTEIHVVADPDWAELWLAPRLPAFRERHPNILFCINGAGDVPLRLGSPDMRLTRDDGPGEILLHDRLLPVTGPDNTRRIAGYDAENALEGMPLLHLKDRLGEPASAGWTDWIAAYGLRREGPERGVRYDGARLALEAVRENIGFLICGLSLILEDLRAGTIVLPFEPAMNLAAPHPYRLALRPGAERRPQILRFVSWLREASAGTRREMEAVLSPAPATA